MSQSMDMKIVVLGASSVGKTSILYRYCNGVFQNGTLPTIGAGFFTHLVQIDDWNMTLILWDTAGEERFKSVAPSLLHGANALILVYDVTKKETFDEMGVYYDMFMDNVDVEMSKELPILVLGNKIDLVDSEHIADNVVKEWCKFSRIPLEFRCSALSGENISEPITELVRLLLKRERKQALPVLQFQNPEYDKKRSSCIC